MKSDDDDERRSRHHRHRRFRWPAAHWQRIFNGFSGHGGQSGRRTELLLCGTGADGRAVGVRRQCGGHHGILPRTTTAQTYQLLHCVVGDGRLSGWAAGHSVCGTGIGGFAAQFVRLPVDAVYAGGAVHDIDILLGGSVGGSLLGHSVSVGVLAQCSNENGDR